MRRIGLIVLGVLSLPVWADERLAYRPDSVGYRQLIVPFFAAYCQTCHGGEKPKGGFAVNSRHLPNDFADPVALSRWREVVNVLNSHEMPPKKEKQPRASEVAKVVDWITEQAVQAESARRSSMVVLRRLNRAEYQNTIRELCGIDYDVNHFPQDPPAAGFDNNGELLSLSPLHMEIYMHAAAQILDRALVEGEQPKKIKWRFDPKVGPLDRTRVRLDETNHPIVNGNNNKQEGDWVVIHHHRWDTSVDARDFRVPVPGDYIIRLRAAGRVPDRSAVVQSVKPILDQRRNEQNIQNPAGKRYHDAEYQHALKHFQTDRMYDYGPPRLKLTLRLGSQPRVVDEFDLERTPEQAREYEFLVRFTTESAEIRFDYAYSIPSVLENFWLQDKETFARPEAMIDWFEIEGPIFDTWPPSPHRRILFDSPNKHLDEGKYAFDVLRRFMRRAYRRPVHDDEVRSKMQIFETSRQEGVSFVQAIKKALTAVLVSPHFLYLVEVERGTGQTLNDHEIAARLSYFLWSSMPDDELMRLADAGHLLAKSQRVAQVERMLADRKIDAFVKNFAGQWLGLRDVGKNPPAPDYYPRYDRHLEVSIVRESEEFFREVLLNDLPVTTLLKSDFVVVNERLARFYGIPGVRGDQFRKVRVPPGVHRGGIPTQASILTITSNGTRTSPVKRGTWILKTLLGIDPGLPVANAGEIAPKVPGIDKATVRKRLEIHRQLEQCARCHNKIDPLGFALENYNAAGEWRDQEGFGYKGRIEENDPRIDASAEMIDGAKIVGVEGLQDSLLKNEDLFLKCLASKVLTYALGRELGLADQRVVEAAVQHMKTHGKTLRSLMSFVVGSQVFESK